MELWRFASSLKNEEAGILTKTFQEGKDLTVKESRSKEINEIQESYDEFTNGTRNGDHGKTNSFG